MKNKLFHILFAITCILIIISTVSAIDIADNQSVANDAQYISDDTNLDTYDSQPNDVDYGNELIKDYKTTNKTASNNVEVSNYKELCEQVELAKDSNDQIFTINLKPGNYYIDDNSIDWYSSKMNNKKIVFNGNNNTITSHFDSSYFIDIIVPGVTIELNDLIFNNIVVADQSLINLQNGNLIINNCSFGAIEPESFWSYEQTGCVIDAYNSNITIKNSEFTHNSPGFGNGIFMVRSSTLDIYNCKFLNNIAYGNGGAICTIDATVKIFNTEFKANGAYKNGGALYSLRSNVTIYDSKFSDNHYHYPHPSSSITTVLNYKGGAIYADNSKLDIINSDFSDNTGRLNDSIYLKNTNDINVENSNFTNGLCLEASKYSDLNDYIDFIKNLNCFNSVTINIEKNLTANTNLLWGNGKGDVKELVIVGIPTKIYTGYELYGYLDDGDSGAPLTDWAEELLNGSYTVEGNYLSGQNKYQFMKVCEGYTLVLKNMTLKNFTSNYGGALCNWYGNIIINNSVLTNNTAKRGGAIYNYRGQLKINNSLITENNASQTGNNIYNYNSNTTIIRLSNIKSIDYNDNVTVYGKVTNDENLTFSKVTVYVTLNGVTSKIKTDKNGKFNISFTANQTGQNTLQVEYKGNTKYAPSNISQNFNVSKGEATLTINEITGKTYGDDITVTGIITDKKGNPLSKANIYVILNNVTKTVKSDNKGIFTATFEAQQTGINSIKIKYTGSSRYKSTAIKDTLTIKGLTLININQISTKAYKDTVTVTGIVSNMENKKFSNAKIYITLNGIKTNVYTDKNGQFTATFTANKTGQNSLKIQYAGNTRYNATTITQKFNVTKRQTKIIIDPIKDVKLNNNITITGRFTDISNSSFNHVNVFITVNNKEKHIMTENGVFTYILPATYKGTNNITVTYKGNTNYEGTSSTTTVNVS